MPTYNRREFVPHAIRYFLRQAYQPKELIIIDDGEQPVDDLIPEAENIRYIRLHSKITLGAKLNMACELARGEIIANWDDDDWYADRRLEYQVEALQNAKIQVCGINRLLYYDVRLNRAHEYIYPDDQRVWLIGSSLCYQKKFWVLHRFADINVGMDGLFVWSTTADKVCVLHDSSIAVHMIHDRNVSPKKTEGAWWHPYQVEKIRETLGEDWECYQNGNLYNPQKPFWYLNEQPNRAPAVKPLRNVYACLVHEEIECVIDLVKNLRYHDPVSPIILYNGGTNYNLLKSDFPFEKFGAVIYPNAVPLKWGYLHKFALMCMEFALANFEFDTFTIVDSDQLMVRGGYASFLAKSLTSVPGIGMLSSNRERVLADNTTNRVAIQAYNEYELWKPLINSFPDGESKFVHWTFWPSSVFMADAVRDLTRQFKENELLQHIMGRTKIWATEEVILPTMVSMLGYEVINNPSSYDFVRFKTPVTADDIKIAQQKNDIYWVHPVERKYNNHIRTLIRDQGNNYSAKNGLIYSAHDDARKPQPPEAFISKIRKIEGWLSDAEANMLMGIALKACKETENTNHIVEIGSYHGKATVLLASVVKTFNLNAKVNAIDTHDGKLGAEDAGLNTFPPSLSMFKNNIENARLSDTVNVIVDKSYNVKWEQPVTFLLIDGLHDYKNVSMDFNHFAQWVIPGGYVAFHDYADYFPGVKKFVSELLEAGTYSKISMVDSLVILQKNIPAKQSA
ncbi:MAG: CmcI family methyltransferase [Mucilaginibacter sp.]